VVLSGTSASAALGDVDRVDLTVIRELDFVAEEDEGNEVDSAVDFNLRFVAFDADDVHEKRDPGASSFTPDLQSGHSAVSYVSKSSPSSAPYGALNGLALPLRLRMDANPPTTAPRPATTAAASRVDFPVVTTSSTTITRSPGSTRNPRRSVICPSLRSVKI